MNLNEVKSALETINEVLFQLPSKQFVPVHFHVTEVGTIQKHFIDCGGTVRKESVINFQLWEAADYDHRLAPSKLKGIIELSEKILGINPELEVEVEYQGETIGKYGLAFNGSHFSLTSTLTACLAEDACGISEEKRKVPLSEIRSQSQSSCCTPGSGCC